MSDPSEYDYDPTTVHFNVHWAHPEDADRIMSRLDEIVLPTKAHAKAFAQFCYDHPEGLFSAHDESLDLVTINPKCPETLSGDHFEAQVRGQLYCSACGVSLPSKAEEA